MINKTNVAKVTEISKPMRSKKSRDTGYYNYDWSERLWSSFVIRLSLGHKNCRSRLFKWWAKTATSTSRFKKPYFDILFLFFSVLINFAHIHSKHIWHWPVLVKCVVCEDSSPSNFARRCRLLLPSRCWALWCHRFRLLSLARTRRETRTSDR